MTKETAPKYSQGFVDDLPVTIQFNGQDNPSCPKIAMPPTDIIYLLQPENRPAVLKVIEIASEALGQQYDDHEITVEGFTESSAIIGMLRNAFAGGKN